MNSLPEQLSAASTRQLSAQLDAQFRFFHTLATQALDNAGRVVALNLSASRDSVERSSHTLRQLVDATQPRDLLVLRTHAEEQVRSLFNYGRELFNIGANAQPYGLRTIAAATPAATLTFAAPAPAPEPASTFAVESAPEPAPVSAAVPAPEPLLASASAPVEQARSPALTAVTDTSEAAVDDTAQAIDAAPAPAEQAAPPEPVMVQEEPPIVSADEVQATTGEQPVPAARQKPIARAIAKGAPKAAVVPQPMAAPVEDKDSATVARVHNKPKRRK